MKIKKLARTYTLYLHRKILIKIILKFAEKIKNTNNNVKIILIQIHHIGRVFENQKNRKNKSKKSYKRKKKNRS